MKVKSKDHPVHMHNKMVHITIYLTPKRMANAMPLSLLPTSRLMVKWMATKSSSIRRRLLASKQVHVEQIIILLTDLKVQRLHILKLWRCSQPVVGKMLIVCKSFMEQERPRRQFHQPTSIRALRSSLHNKRTKTGSAYSTRLITEVDPSKGDNLLELMALVGSLPSLR
jgi:hypothetical protein